MSYYGIDYGTTNSLLYEYNEGLPNRFVKKSNPFSAVVIENGKIICSGHEAWDYDGTGSFYKSPKRNLANDNVSIGDKINGVSFKDMILQTLNTMISETNHGKEDYYTITIPNTFSGNKYTWMMQWLNESLENADFQHATTSNHVSVFPEPFAAALYYIHTSWQALNKDIVNLVVCDIGGGTTDMCIISCHRNVENGKRNLHFSVVGKPIGNSNLGGDDFDKRLSNKLGLGQNYDTTKNCRNFVMAIKSMLSVNPDTTIGYQGEEYNIKRTEFETCIGKELKELRKMMESLKASCNGAQPDAQWILLPVGGSCKIPKIQEILSEVFKDKNADCAARDDVRIFDSVAMGAALYSAYRAGVLQDYDAITVENHTTNDISYEWGNGKKEVVVMANTPDGIIDNNWIRLRERNCDNEDCFCIGRFVVYFGGSRIIDNIHNEEFPLNGRKIEDVRLQLIFDLENQTLKSYRIIDPETNTEVGWNEN